MRKYIDIIESEYNGNIQKKNTDKRDLVQKLRDVIDHPSTEKFVREVTQRKLDKILKELEREEQAQKQRVEFDRTAPAVILDLEVIFDDKPLSPSDYDKVFVQGFGKKLTFREIINRLSPLNPFKIVLRHGSGYWIGDYSGEVWFYPEDEPEVGEVAKAAKKGGEMWINISDEASQYFRGGTSKYFISFSKYNPSSEFRKKNYSKGKR